MKFQKCMGSVALLMIVAAAMTAKSFAQTELAANREYEPKVMLANTLGVFVDVPVDEIFMYAYDAATQTWRMMPFQIDEQTYGPADSLGSTKKRWFYFIPDWWSRVDTITISSHDGKFNNHDEMVFMVRDLGDKAPDDSWIDNDESKNNLRIELVVEDPENPELKAYGYIFRSSTISEAVPEPYDFNYNPAEDRIETKYYTIRMNEYGTVDEIVIKEPGGNGEDILDLLKIRFNGVIDLMFPVQLVANEKLLHLYEKKHTTEHPIVRLIRSANMTLKFGEYIADNVTFPVRAAFYPFSGTIKGGTSLAPEDLTMYFDGEQVLIILLDIRESWDYSVEADSMKFYNKYNDGIVIDGLPDDEVITTIDIPINAWDLTTGKQGSLFKIAKFKEQKWGSVDLYYFENKSIKLLQGDSDIFGNEDTGDSLSYGDNGILFRNKPDQDSVTIELDYTVYFLPEKHLIQSDGERLFYIVNNPVKVTSRSVSSDVEHRNYAAPIDFKLEQNYPNPFNNSTFISFYLPVTEQVRLQIFDANGRHVKTLANGKFSSGLHKLHWDGSDDHNHQAPSGIYFYKIQTKDFSQIKKLVLIK